MPKVIDEPTFPGQDPEIPVSEILRNPQPGEPTNEQVDHPDHYGGADDPYEAIKVIEAWDLGFCLGNCVKYINRAGRKPGQPKKLDLEKARWYLDRAIQTGGK